MQVILGIASGSIGKPDDAAAGPGRHPQEIRCAAAPEAKRAKDV
jgi:hypothetical protein